jgi:hypothetical protein
MRWAFLVLGLWGISAGVSATPQNVKSPLDATTLLALVAGDALPENVVSSLLRVG